MARNIEIKARIDSLDALAAKAATIATEGPIEIAQDDTFFRGGSFLELEVVLADGEAAEAGVAESHALMQRLGIGPAQLIEGAYVDLLAGVLGSA